MNQETKQMQNPILLHKSLCLTCEMQTNLFKLQDLNVVIEIIECLHILIRKNISQVQLSSSRNRTSINTTSHPSLARRVNELFPFCYSVKTNWVFIPKYLRVGQCWFLASGRCTRSYLMHWAWEHSRVWVLLQRRPYRDPDSVSTNTKKEKCHNNVTIS